MCGRQPGFQGAPPCHPAGTLASGARLRFDRAQRAIPAPVAERPLIDDPTFYLLAAVAATLLGLSKGGFIGMGVMALPMMSLYVPPMQAAVIILPTLMAQDMLTLWTFRRTWSGWNLAIMLPSVAVGIAAATLLAAVVTAAHVKLLIGIIAIAFVVRHWLGTRFERLSPRPNVATGIIFGALGGGTTMLANAGGPVWQMHLLPQRLDKLTYVGTFTVLFAVGNLVKIPAYHALGQLTLTNLSIGAVLLPVAVASNYAGIWLMRRTPTEQFYRIAYVLMLVIALELMRSAAVELLRG